MVINYGLEFDAVFPALFKRQMKKHPLYSYAQKNGNLHRIWSFIQINIEHSIQCLKYEFSGE